MNNINLVDNEIYIIDHFNINLLLNNCYILEKKYFEQQVNSK